MKSILKNNGRKGDWMQTYTGKAFYPFDPRPEDFDIEDIAHALSMLCRYGGHCLYFYSVAEHCVLMSCVAARENALWALMHDATEAYIGDMIRPLKWHMPKFKEVEDVLMDHIAEVFGLSRPMPEEIKILDNSMLAMERNHIMSKPPYSWELTEDAPGGTSPFFWTPYEAETAFLNRYSDLTASK